MSMSRRRGTSYLGRYRPYKRIRIGPAIGAGALATGVGAISSYFKKAKPFVNAAVKSSSVKSGFKPSGSTQAGGGGARAKTFYKKRRLTRYKKKRIVRFKKFSRKVNKVTYSNLGTKQMATQTSLAFSTNDNVVRWFAFSVLGNSTAQNYDHDAGVPFTGTSAPFENDVVRLFYYAGLGTSDGKVGTANKADKQCFLKSIHNSVTFTANTGAKPFAPFTLEMYTIKAKKDISSEDVYVQLNQVNTCFLNYWRTLYDQSASNVGITGGAAPTFIYDEAAVPNLPVAQTSYVWAPTSISAFGKNFTIVKKTKFSFMNVGDSFSMDLGFKKFTKMTENYWANRFISKKYTTVYLFRVSPLIPGSGTNDFNLNIQQHRVYSWSVEGDTADASAEI